MSMWNSAKAKVQLRLSVQRLRTLQQKKEAQAKSARRDIANLIERGKIETARIKVETIINEDIHIELLELLELYCELLLARFGLLDQNTREPDPGIIEGVCSIIHAAPRTELKELHVLRDILMHKYGREFSSSVMENHNECVSPRVMAKITNATPSPGLVNAYIKEIAKAYGVPWSSPDDAIPENDDEEEIKDAKQEVGSSSDVPEKKIDQSQEKDPSITSAPSDPSKTTADTNNPSTLPSAPGPVEDEFDLLAKRFAELKKR